MGQNLFHFFFKANTIVKAMKRTQRPARMRFSKGSGMFSENVMLGRKTIKPVIKKRKNHTVLLNFIFSPLSNYFFEKPFSRKPFFPE